MFLFHHIHHIYVESHVLAASCPLIPVPNCKTREVSGEIHGETTTYSTSKPNPGHSQKPDNTTAQTLWNNSPKIKMLSADVQARTEFPVPFSNFGHLHTVTIQLGVQEPDLREEIRRVCSCWLWKRTANKYLGLWKTYRVKYNFVWFSSKLIVLLACC